MPIAMIDSPSATMTTSPCRSTKCADRIRNSPCLRFTYGETIISTTAATQATARQRDDQVNGRPWPAIDARRRQPGGQVHVRYRRRTRRGDRVRIASGPWNPPSRHQQHPPHRGVRRDGVCEPDVPEVHREDHAKHDHDLREPDRRRVVGQPAGQLRDREDEDQVEEELQRRDAVLGLFGTARLGRFGGHARHRATRIRLRRLDFTDGVPAPWSRFPAQTSSGSIEWRRRTTAP